MEKDILHLKKISTESKTKQRQWQKGKDNIQIDKQLS